MLSTQSTKAKNDIKNLSRFENYTQNRDNGLGQDYSLSGKGRDTIGNYYYLIVADGHGKGNYIKFLSSKRFSWDTVLAETNAKSMSSKLKLQIENIQKKYQTERDLNTDYTNDGSTLSIVKIYKHMIKCYWIGDSQIRIFNNKVEIFKSKNHNGRNKKEQKRLQRESEKINNSNYTISKVPSLCIVDPTTITMKKHPQIHFFANNKCEKMMITRALGHNEKMFPFFETKTILVDELETSKLRVVVASDGFWDMFCNSNKKDLEALVDLNAKTLVQRALLRWKQSWYFKNNTKTITLSERDIDDISVALFHVIGVY